MMKIIADRITGNGLRMGGIRDVDIADESTAPKEVLSVGEDEGTLLITGSLAEVAMAEIDAVKKRGVVCIIIPDMVSGHEDTTRRLVKEAVGFELE